MNVVMWNSSEGGGRDRLDSEASEGGVSDTF